MPNACLLCGTWEKVFCCNGWLSFAPLITKSWSSYTLNSGSAPPWSGWLPESFSFIAHKTPRGHNRQIPSHSQSLQLLRVLFVYLLEWMLRKFQRKTVVGINATLHHILFVSFWFFLTDYSPFRNTDNTLSCVCVCVCVCVRARARKHACWELVQF
jgi:hypothetical protein